MKNFVDDNSQLYYWDINSKELQKRNTRSVFMNMNMYRDEDHHPEEPTIIESIMAIFEAEVAPIIQEKLLNNGDVILKRSELEKLRIFLSLLSFRSNLRMEQYKNENFDMATRKELKEFSSERFEALWKKELLELAKTRSYDEIRNNNNIDEIIKTEFLNDLTGMYMTLVDARGGDFLITDVYPTLEIYPIKPQVNIHLHCFYPLSSERMLVLNHIMFKDEVSDPVIIRMKSTSKIKGDLICSPKNKYVMRGVMLPDDEFIYKVKKIYAPDVQYITALQLNEARVGVVFGNPDRVLDSISAFNLRNDTKQKFPELENSLKSLDD